MRTFEQASGLRINRSKSAIVPCRRLEAAEVASLDRIRGAGAGAGVRLSYKERLLGLFIGPDATITDQFARPMSKLESTIRALNPLCEVPPLLALKL